MSGGYSRSELEQATGPTKSCSRLVWSVLYCCSHAHGLCTCDTKPVHIAYTRKTHTVNDVNNDVNNDINNDHTYLFLVCGGKRQSEPKLVSSTHST